MPAGPVLVVAPHPDDEVLLAAGAIARARRAGHAVDVAIMTNGGLGCERDGGVRQAESVAGLAMLGVAEAHVHFLGLPDGSLADLGDRPLPAVTQRDRAGHCVAVATTSAWRGRAQQDVHTRLTGRPGPFTVATAVDDLRALIDELRPALVITTHPIDTHPDHAATAVLVQRAVQAPSAASEPTLGAVPEPSITLWRGIVHVDDVWPMAHATDPPWTPTRPMPPLPEPLAHYAPLRLPLGDLLAHIPRGKLDVIAAHRSQTGPHPEENWLVAFDREDEVFWPRLLARAPPRVSQGALTVDELIEIDVALPSGPRRYRLWREGARVVVSRPGRRLEGGGVDVGGEGPLQLVVEIGRAHV
jgi:LmbE family N-acetylglucosaminyl deacetylase